MWTINKNTAAEHLAYLRNWNSNVLILDPIALADPTLRKLVDETMDLLQDVDFDGVQELPAEDFDLDILYHYLEFGSLPTRRRSSRTFNSLHFKKFF
jgi:hypothetical protein